MRHCRLGTHSHFYLVDFKTEKLPFLKFGLFLMGRYEKN